MVCCMQYVVQTILDIILRICCNCSTICQSVCLSSLRLSFVVLQYTLAVSNVVPILTWLSSSLWSFFTYEKKRNAICGFFKILCSFFGEDLSNTKCTFNRSKEKKLLWCCRYLKKQKRTEQILRNF